MPVQSNTHLIYYAGFIIIIVKLKFAVLYVANAVKKRSDLLSKVYKKFDKIIQSGKQRRNCNLSLFYQGQAANSSEVIKKLE